MTYNSVNKSSEELQPLQHDVELFYMQPAEIPKRTICDLVSFVIFVFLSVTAFIAASISLGSGAYWFHEIKGKPMADCLVIMLTAALPLALGAFIVVLVVTTVIITACFTTLPTASLSGRTCCSKILRILSLHVVPFFGLIIGIAGSIIALYFSWMAYQQPDMNKSFNVPGLDGPVSIRRDVNGLPHISAASHRDALFGQGLAHGQDRLWQIEFQRLVGKGRLSEFVGSAGSTMDKQIRTLGFPAGAQRMCSNASPESQALAQRYVDGLNFYVNNYKERPAEFLFMGKGLLEIHTVEPFEVMDCCLIAMLLMWQMGANVPTEIKRFKVFWSSDRSYDQVNELFINQTNITGTILTPEQLDLSEADAVAARAREENDFSIERDLYDGYLASLRAKYNPQGASRGMKAQSAGAPAKRKEASTCDPLTFLLKEFNLLDFNVHHASNSWAGRAAGGVPAVGASDPHLAINVPSVWYWSHLEWTVGGDQTFDAAGVGLPGLPGVHIGKTTNTSWGITMSMTDLSDLFIITPDPTNPNNYLVNGSSIPYSYRTEVISVKGGDTITLTIPETIYGPVVTEALNLPQPIQFAIYADFLRNDTSSLDGLLCLNFPTTTTAMDVRDCLSNIRSPGFSIPIEDVHGNIAYSMTGLHPHRRAGHTGMYPTMGNGSFDYLGEIPFVELPTLTILASQSELSGGYVSAANQKTYPDGYKYSLGYDFCYPYRGSRLHEVLSENPTQLSNVTFHMKLQRDTHSNIAAQWMQILNDTSYPEVAQFHQTLASNAAAVAWYSKLQNWDLNMRIGNVEGTFFWRWWRELLRPPMDAINAVNVGVDSDDQSTYWSSGQEQFPIYEITRPTPTMTAQCKSYIAGAAGCGDMAAKIFIGIANGFDEASSRWGIDYNQLTTKHLMLENTPLSCLFQRTINKDGDASTIDVSDFDIEGNMEGSFASSMRQIYDWSQPTWIHFTFPGGESGNPFSQFFQNFLQPYSGDQYASVTTSGQDLIGGSTFSQSLNP